MTDIRSARRFFMGVMGWTPEVVMDDAALEDLCDAAEGFAARVPRGPGSFSGPAAGFLQEMMKKFPDGDT